MSPPIYSQSDWKPIKPLERDTSHLPALDLAQVFPKSCDWLAGYCRAVAESLQVDPGLVAPMAISLASLAVTRSVKYHVYGDYYELAPIWTLTQAEPGSKKSPTLHQLLKPFNRQPHSDGEPVAQTLEGQPSTGAMPAELKDTAPPVDASQRVQLGIELFADNLTHLAAVRRTKELGERLGIVSAEGHFLSDLLISVRAGGIDLYLKGWDGEALFIDRVSDSDCIRLYAPEVVIALLVQPDVVNDILNCRPLVARGFPQRFLFSKPACLLSNKSFTEIIPVPSDLAALWDARIRAMLAAPRHEGVPSSVLRLTTAGLSRFDDFKRRMTDRRLDNQQPSLMREWYAKAYGQGMRIAGILALLGREGATEIDDADVAAAEAWIEYFAAHTEATFIGQNSYDEVACHAKRVIDWMKKQGRQTVKRSVITQALRCRGMEHAQNWVPVFAALEDGNYIRPLVAETGGRPSHTFQVNPWLLTPTAATQAGSAS